MPAIQRADVVGFSRGITSAVTAWFVAQEHPETTILLFHDPGEEPEDNERFAAEVCAYIGIPITDYSDGRTVSQVFDDEGTLGNNRMTPCSRILKQEMSRRFILGQLDAGKLVTLSFGFHAKEYDRWSKARQRYADIYVEVDAPLIRRDLTKNDCLRIVAQEWGIRPPLSYDHYDNANCRGCVKGGLAYWGQVYLFDREKWEERAAQEDEYGHTILHSRYGGYPQGSLRNMLPRCLELAAKWREKRAKDEHFPLIEAPCACSF